MRVVQERRVGQPGERRQRHVELAIHSVTQHPDRAEHMFARALPLPAVSSSISTELRTSTGTRLATLTQPRASLAGARPGVDFGQQDTAPQTPDGATLPLQPTSLGSWPDGAAIRSFGLPGGHLPSVLPRSCRNAAGNPCIDDSLRTPDGGRTRARGLHSNYFGHHAPPSSWSWDTWSLRPPADRHPAQA